MTNLEQGGTMPGMETTADTAGTTPAGETRTAAAGPDAPTPETGVDRGGVAADGQQTYDGDSGGAPDADMECVPSCGNGVFGDGSYQEDIILPDNWRGQTPFPETDTDPLGLGGEDSLPGFDETPPDPSGEGNAAGNSTETPLNPQETEDGQKHAAQENPPQSGHNVGAEDTSPRHSEKAESTGTDAGKEPDYKAFYEAVMEQTRAEKYRAVYQQQRNAGMSDAVARMVAASESGGKSYPLDLTGSPADTAGSGGSPESGGTDAGGSAPQALTAQLQKLHELFPTARELPDSVIQAAVSGGDVVAAYAGHQIQGKNRIIAERDQTIAELQARIRTLEQNASNVIHAPVRGVSGSGARQDPEDWFLKGFRSEL